MRPFIKSLTLSLAITMICSCASIVSKTKWPVDINSSPAGASVTVINKKGKEVYKGTTPATIRLKSGAGFFAKESYQVKLSLAGYNDKTVHLDCKLNGWYAGNVLIGGLIGLLIVDPATGAMYKLSTDSISEKLTNTTASADPSLKIMNINDISKNWRKHLTPIN